MQIIIKDINDEIKSINYHNNSFDFNTNDIKSIYIVLNGVPAWVDLNKFLEFTKKWGNLEDY